MSSLVVSNFKTGYETDKEPFDVDNDAFPILNNAYVWRGRVRRKRGTTQLGRLQINLVSGAAGGFLPVNPSPNSLNLILGLFIDAGAQFIPGTIANPLIIVFGAPINQTLTDNTGTGTMTVSGSGTTITSATINYATGEVLIAFGSIPGSSSTVTFTGGYYPCLPVMGLEDFDLNFNTTPGITNFPVLVALDTEYSYQFNQSTNVFYNVNFYKQSHLEFFWSGQNYQQFFSTNFQGALWVTNNNFGTNFMLISNAAYISATQALITITGHGIPSGIAANTVYLFINEIMGPIGADLNGQTGTVNAVVNPNNLIVNFPNATIGPGDTYMSGGIAQYLTYQAPSAVGDGIKWYDGDPTTPASPLGWVNFMPPLSNVGLTGGQPLYLFGAKIIAAFKDRLLFFGCWTGLSTGLIAYNPNQLVCSQNGTVYYANPVPVNQTSDPSAWYQNVAGRGFRLNAPIMQEIIGIADNGDLLICDYENQPLKLISTGDDSFPFVYQTVSSELGGQSTFSSIALDAGLLSMGTYGLAIKDQSSARRADLKIPDQIYDISAANNGSQRVTALRDYRNEFIYFTYPPVNNSWIFPSRTLLYNYRDDTWATFDENFTHYGTFRKTSNYTWATLPFRTWASWTDPWNFGASSQRYPAIIGGNQQGFVMIKDKGTKEDNSQFISAITGLVITSPNHCLKNGDFIQISGIIGDAGMTALNGQIYKIMVINNAANLNTFTLLPTALQPTGTSGTYAGNGVYRRLIRPLIKTKQFPIFWSQNRQTRIGTQRYMLENTNIAPNSQITVNMYVSQNSNDPNNEPLDATSLIYSNIVLTSAEPNFPGQEGQAQIWHRMSESFIGDTVQMGFTLNDAQMRNSVFNEAEVTLHAIAIELHPGPTIA